MISERAFRFDSAYTTDPPEEAPERFAFFEHGWEMTRRQRALKVWAVLRAMGAKGIAKSIEDHVDLRAAFDRRVEDSERLELLGSGLSISCFRFVARDPDRSASLNREILERLNHEGRYFLSPTVLDGRFSLRISIVNLNTAQQHLDQLVRDVERLGEELE